MVKRNIKASDRIGQVCGRLTITKVYREDRRTYCECSCSCGNTLVSRVDALQSGATVSCGCYNKEVTSKINSTHGMLDTNTYSSWDSMKQRCLNPKSTRYDFYKDIPICEKWMEFEGFYEDMGDRPDGTTLDRIDNSLGYCKENCRWATGSYQSKNQGKRKVSDSPLSKYKGVSLDKRQKSGKKWSFSVTKNYVTFRMCCNGELEAAAYFDYCTKLLYSGQVTLNNVGYELTEEQKREVSSKISIKFKEKTNE
jgi:hypothetical protein